MSKYNFGGGHLGFQDGRHAKSILLYSSPTGQDRHISGHVSGCTYIFGVEENIQFNSNSLFSTQHIVHTTMFLAYNVLKRERAEDSAYVGSFPNIII